jgi:hypothetical protein
LWIAGLELGFSLLHPPAHLGVMKPQLVLRHERRRNEFVRAAVRLLQNDQRGIVVADSEMAADLFREGVAPAPADSEERHR